MLKVNDIRIGSKYSGLPVKKFFKQEYQYVPFVRIASLLRKGGIRINGRKADMDTILKAGDLVQVPEFWKDDADADVKVDPAKIKMLEKSIIYQDDDMIIINKPYGIAVQGGTKIRISIDEIASQLPGDVKLVHRLDKDTTGALLLAKGAVNAAKFASLFKYKTVEKRYLAITCGRPREEEGIIEKPLLKMRAADLDFERMEEDAKGKKAITRYRVLDSNSGFSLVEFSPITGITHQIRCHANMLGTPILYDEKYNQLTIKTRHISKQLYLHSYRIAFVYDGVLRVHKAKLPKEFVKALKVLGLNATL